MIINRDNYVNKLLSKKDNGLIKVITGLRRSGKSFLLDPLFKETLISMGIDEDHIIKVDFDSRTNANLRNPDNLVSYINSKILDDNKYYLLFDEIQLVDDFVSVLNEFLRKNNLDIYVTGSNSKFLSSDIATEFRGRGDEIFITPFTFKEFKEFSGLDVRNAWNQYIRYGGLPQTIILNSAEDKEEYLISLYKSTYLIDVVQRNHLIKSDSFEQLLKVLSSNIGSLTSPAKIENTFLSKGFKSITNDVISKYLNHIKEAFLVKEATRFNLKGRKYIASNSKYYFLDLGVRNAITHFKEIDEPHLMENAIYNELVSRGYEVDIGIVPVRSGKDLLQLEIDFVASKSDKKYYIQSCLRIEDKEDVEIKPLLKMNDGYKKILVVKDGLTPHYNNDGILYLDLFDFLLDKDSLTNYWDSLFNNRKISFF